MLTTFRFLILWLLLLSLPAGVYLAVGLYTGRTSDLSYLLYNYLYMAAPHGLVSLWVLWPAGRRPWLLWLLALLNAVLILFQSWILVEVPPRESGLAWVLYIPVWGAVLAAAGLAGWLHEKHKHRKLALPIDRDSV
jgi:hypothetical protein